MDEFEIIIEEAEPLVIVEERPIPEEDPEWVVLDESECEGAGDAQFRVYMDTLVFSAIDRYAIKEKRHEVGGLLLGKWYMDQASGTEFIIIKAMMIAYGISQYARFTFTPDSYNEMMMKKDNEFPDLAVVGWFHTHPGFGIFLSGADTFTHTNFFRQPFHAAYVVDPVSGTRGLFHDEDGILASCSIVTLVEPALIPAPMYEEDRMLMEAILKRAVNSEFGVTRLERRLGGLRTEVEVLDSMMCRMDAREEEERANRPPAWRSRAACLIYLVGFQLVLLALLIVAITRISVQQAEIGRLANRVIQRPVAQAPTPDFRAIVAELEQSLDRRRPTPVPTEPAGVIVESGDTLSSVCIRRYGGSSPGLLAAVTRINGLTDENKLLSGQMLYLPPLETLFAGFSLEDAEKEVDE